MMTNNIQPSENERRKIYFVYKTSNLLNGKVYIGQHYGFLNDSYLGSGKLLLQAVQKYGAENFKREILEICPDKKSVDEAEIKWIDFYNAAHDRQFYNLAAGGTGGDTYAGLPPEELQRIRKIKSEQSQGKNNPNYGKHMSEESKKKLRKTFKERGISIGVNNPMYGRTGVNNPRSILIYAIVDGEKIFYAGIREASRQTGIPSPNIIRALHSDGRFSAGKSPTKQKIYWFFEKKDEEE